MRRDQHIGELLEDVPHLIAVPVPRHLLQCGMILWHCPDVAVVGQGSAASVSTAKQSVISRWVSGTLNSAHQSACGTSSMITCQSCRRWKYGSSIRAAWVMNRISPSMRRMLQMLDDVGDHPIAGLAVDRRNRTSGVRLARSFSVWVIRKMLGWTKRTFLPSRARRWAYRTAAYVFALPHGPSTKYKIKIYTPVQKKSPRGLADTSRVLHWSDARRAWA